MKYILDILGNPKDEYKPEALQKFLEELYFENPELAEEIQEYVNETTYLEICKEDIDRYLQLAEIEYGDNTIETVTQSRKFVKELRRGEVIR